MRLQDCAFGKFDPIFNAFLPLVSRTQAAPQAVQETTLPDETAWTTSMPPYVESLPEVYHVPDIQITDDYYDCPVDHQDPSGPSLKVFLRRCMRKNAAVQQERTAKYIVYLQGGPGHECSQAVPSDSGMLGYLLSKGYIVLFLDQRGTGRSTPLDAKTLSLQGNLDAQVRYCKNFRADSIVRDCEVVREAMGISSWSLLGQSYGGFIILTYLSICPGSLEAVLLTGGVAPIRHDHPDPVYTRLAKRIIKRNEDYYRKYPQDEQRVKTIVHHLDTSAVDTPNGGRLTSRRFLQIGIDLGLHGGIDRIHNLISKIYSDLQQFGFISYKGREQLENSVHYDGNPIYSILHESIYCQSSRPSDWSSYRILSAHPEFNTTRKDKEPIYFYGENIFPWMFEDYSQLRPLKDVAHRLAQESWTPLYDLEKLKKNLVPLAASVYIEDMYVHIDLAIETIQSVANTKDLVTNRWLHNGLRHNPEEILGYLLDLLEADEQPPR